MISFIVKEKECVRSYELYSFNLSVRGHGEQRSDGNLWWRDTLKCGTNTFSNANYNFRRLWNLTIFSFREQAQGTGTSRWHIQKLKRGMLMWVQGTHRQVTVLPLWLFLTGPPVKELYRDPKNKVEEFILKWNTAKLTNSIDFETIDSSQSAFIYPKSATSEQNSRLHTKDTMKLSEYFWCEAFSSHHIYHASY